MLVPEQIEEFVERRRTGGKIIRLNPGPAQQERRFIHPFAFVFRFVTLAGIPPLQSETDEFIADMKIVAIVIMAVITDSTPNDVKK